MDIGALRVICVKGRGGKETEGEERNSKRTAGKLLLLEISISRNCSSVKCQNVCERLLETIAAFGARRTMG